MDLKPDMKVCLLFTFVHLLPIILTVRVREPRAVDIRSDFRCFVVRIQSVVDQRTKKTPKISNDDIYCIRTCSSGELKP